jgi:transcriptional regulator with XRE-family HTH domain
MAIVFRQTELARRGRARRESLGRSLDEVAQSLGISRKRLTEFERTGVGTLRRVIDWAQALDMAPAELAFGADASAPSAPNPHS